nr:hypothetical protein [Halolamina pelagica]
MRLAGRVHLPPLADGDTGAERFDDATDRALGTAPPVDLDGLPDALTLDDSDQ